MANRAGTDDALPSIIFLALGRPTFETRPLLLTCHLRWNERFGPGFFLFTLTLIVGVLTCRNLRLQRIALSVFLEAYLFLLFLFVFAWPKSQIAQHTFGTDRAVRRLPPQKIMSFGEL
jgi:hypothetical protein